MIFFDVLHSRSKEEEERLFGAKVALLGRSSMDFTQLRESQSLYETNLVAQDTDLKTLNTPEYLLERGILGEAIEALEEITVKSLGVESDAFRHELIDIVVFLSSLFNHIELYETEIHERVKRAQTPNTLGESPESILEDKIIVQAKQLLLELTTLGIGHHDFRNNVIMLALYIDALLEEVQMTEPELHHRTSYIVMKNFSKYRPEVIAEHTMENGLKISRDAFQKKTQAVVMQ